MQVPKDIAESTGAKTWADLEAMGAPVGSFPELERELNSIRQAQVEFLLEAYAGSLAQDPTISKSEFLSAISTKCDHDFSPEVVDLFIDYEVTSTRKGARH